MDKFGVCRKESGLLRVPGGMAALGGMVYRRACDCVFNRGNSKQLELPCNLITQGWVWMYLRVPVICSIKSS